MIKNYTIFKNKGVALVVLFLFFIIGLSGQVTQSFVFTGSVQSFVVPPCVSTITLDVKGAQGGSNPMGVPGGLGGTATGVLSVVPGNVLTIYVGGMSGFNGGGAAGLSPCLTATGGVGGGASDVRLNGSSLNNRVIVGAGGGGAGGDRSNTCGRGTGGGGGGGYYGGGGGCGYPSSSTTVPTGGTQTSGGSGGISGFSTTQNGLPGVLGDGGAGGIETSSNQAGANTAFPGGAGGGLVGANGQQPPTNIYTGQSGAGGSSYVGTLTNTTTVLGNRTGNGIVTISYNFNGFGVIGTSSSYSVCSGTPVILTASNVVTYTWTPGGSNASSVTVTPTSNTSYTVQGTNLQGCVSSVVLPVFVDNTPTVTAISSNTTNGICPNTSLILTGAGATTYTWSGGVTNAVAFSPTTSATYVVTGANACGTATAAISLSIHPLPPVTAAVNNPTVCTGNSVILNGGGALTYTWTPSAPNNAPFFPNATTNYTVRGTSALGCTASAVQGVTVLITPTVTPVVTPTATCLGGTATLSASGATGYTWTPGSNLVAATVTVAPLGPTTYTLFRTNGACSSTSTVNLIVYALPLVNASGTPSQICAGTAVNLVVVGPITNTWLPGSFNNANLVVYPNFSTNYTVTGSNGNCTLSAVVSISVNPSPTVSISASSLVICQGQNVILTANGVGPLTYTWLPTNTNNTTETFTPAATTLYTLTAENSFSCTTSVNQVIVVNPLPNMNLSSNVPYICAGNTASLSITSPSSNPNVVYNWNTGPTGPSILVSPTITTNYFVTGTNTITGCPNTNTIALAVYISTFAVTGPTAICKGEPAVFSAAGDAITYAWTANGNPVGNGSPSITVSPVLSTTYNVVGTNVSCTSTLAVPLIVNQIPNVTAVAAKGQICRFEVSTIVGSGATSYSWNTGAATPTISFTLSITTTYTLTGTDINGCAKTVTVTQFVATCIGLDDQQSDGNAGLTVYPNPNNGNFFIRSDVNLTLSIVNTLGQVVSTMKLSAENPDSYRGEITVSSLPTGIYFITGEANGLKVNKKVVVER